MVNKTISITYELDLLLKNEDNASALISRLLWDYYNSFQSLDIKENKIEDMQREIKVLSKEVEQIQEKEKEDKLTEEQEQVIRLKADEETKHLREVILKEIEDGKQNN